MTNTIPNVPRELLERVKSLCEYWFVRGQQQHMSESEHKTWHALGFGSSAFTELRALLSAPSPAGVDGLKRYEVFPYLDDDVAELDICESDDGTFVKYDDATAIIDGLRGEAGQQAQRIGELASHLEFAVTLLTVAGLAGNAQVEAMRAALSAGNEPKQCT